MKKIITLSIRLFACLLISFVILTNASNISNDNYANTILPVESFTVNSNFSSTSTSTSLFYSPSSCSTGGLQYLSSGGCTGGYIGFSGAMNNFFSCYLRTPAVNCTGHSSVKLGFDLSNSYIAAHQNTLLDLNDRIRFYMYIDGTYKNASSIKINSTEMGQTDINGIWLKFDVARSCVHVEVTFDMSAYSDLSNVLFYMEPNCAYNDTNIFNVAIDNISIE